MPGVSVDTCGLLFLVRIGQPTPEQSTIATST